MMSSATGSLLICFFVFLVPVNSIIPEDEISGLPGLSWKPNFRQFSGYLKATGSRQLHYWFVESAGNPSKDPLVLWLNGGPGCSSLDGFLSEHGPFLISEDGKTLTKNDYAWNNVANIIYLEAPAGVGYSYSADRNYTTNDDQTSLDNYYALIYFLSRYSEFSQNEFFVTGESYGGIYVPTLAVRLASDKRFNFKGFAVGNGLSDYAMNDNSIIYFAQYHGLIGQKDWLNLVALCCRGANSTLGNCDFANSASSSCEDAVSDVGQIIGQFNIYNLYNECYPPPPPSDASTLVVHPQELSPLFGFKTPDVAKLISGNVSVTAVPPCVNVTGITNYLNTPSVRKALHIPDNLPKWEICSGTIAYKQQYATMRNQYINILSLGKQRILVYNGDVDMACNFMGDEWFVDSLQRKLKVERSPWFYNATDGTQQIGGFIQQFTNLTYLTVKGAGHMVPQDKPIQALTMFTNFVQGNI